MAREAVTGGNRRSPLAGEARETSGITSVLLLAYLDRAGGQGAVDEVLERCGLADAETELRDENCWFSWETKIRLFEATADVLAKPDFLEEMAALSLDLNVGSGLRAALRTLGSPQLVYRSVVRANARFNGSHAMELVSIGRRQAITRFHDIAGQGRYHPLDCQYSAAMLRIVPALFALPPAQLRHRECVGDGDEACVYELEWREYAGIGRRAIAAGGTTALALGASLMAAPSALPAALGVGVASTGLLALSELRRHRQSWQALQREASDHAEVAQRLFATLQDLTSDLRLDEVLTKVTRNAQAAVGGREFALLVRDGETLACQSSSGLPAGTVTALEAWAARSPRVADQSVVLDDVSEVEVLRPLTASAMPLCSLASLGRSCPATSRSSSHSPARPRSRCTTRAATTRPRPRPSSTRSPGWPTIAASTRRSSARWAGAGTALSSSSTSITSSASTTRTGTAPAIACCARPRRRWPPPAVARTRPSGSAATSSRSCSTV